MLYEPEASLASTAIPSFMLSPLLANSCNTTLFSSIIASLDNLPRNLENVEWSASGLEGAYAPEGGGFIKGQT